MEAVASIQDLPATRASEAAAARWIEPPTECSQWSSAVEAGRGVEPPKSSSEASESACRA